MKGTVRIEICRADQLEQGDVFRTSPGMATWKTVLNTFDGEYENVLDIALVGETVVQHIHPAHIVEVQITVPIPNSDPFIPAWNRDRV